MSAIAMRIKGKKGLSVVQRGLAVLRKYGTNAHLWIPGVGYFNGQDLGNYLASDGTASASVDNPIGLVLDQLYGQGTLGPNQLVSPGDFTNAAWQKTTITPTGGVADPFGGNAATTLTAGAASSGLFQSVTAAAWLQSGMWIRRRTGAGVIRFRDAGAGNPQTLSVTGAWAYFKTPINPTAGPYACVLDIMTAGDAVDVYAPTTQQVLGIPATQATTANKPTLRRGVTNLLTYSGDVANAAWGKGAGVGSVTPGQLGPFGANDATRITAIQGSGCYINQSTSLANGTLYSRFAVVKAETTGVVVFEFYDNGSYANTKFDVVGQVITGLTLGASITPIPGASGWFICARSWTTGATGSQSASVTYTDNYGSATSNSTVLLHRMGIFQGALTAQQILQCGGIPLTTSAPASSAGGNWGWQFVSATNQSLQTSSATGASGYLGVACAAQSLQYQDPAASTNTVSSVAGMAFKLRNNGDVWFRCTNASASNNDAIGVGAYAAGIPIVIRGQWSYPGSSSLWKNGTQIGTSALSASPAGSQGLYIGNSVGTSEPFNGLIYGTAKIDAVVSAADALAIDRLLATFTGPTGVTF